METKLLFCLLSKASHARSKATPNPNLGDGEGVPGVDAAFPHALADSDPPLVAGLNPQDVQVALAHRGGDQLVPPTLVAVGGPDEELVLVVGLAVAILPGVGAQDRGGGGLVGGEASLGLGLDLGGSLSQDVSNAVEEVGRRLVGDAPLAALLHDDLQVVHVIKAVDVPQVDAREGSLLGWVPVGWQSHLVPVALVVGGSTEVSSLGPKDVGGVAVRGKRWLSIHRQSCCSGEEAEDSSASHTRLNLSGVVLLVVGGGSHGEAPACAHLGGHQLVPGASRHLGSHLLALVHRCVGRLNRLMLVHLLSLDDKILIPTNQSKGVAPFPLGDVSRRVLPPRRMELLPWNTWHNSESMV
mmetsp:Transcript_11912/g.32916  ORF Transcript_11912/g.32916 Transcript_11912/m.32916 type:complete len:355 (-) Transcript_11912:1347-2411(-)